MKRTSPRLGMGPASSEGAEEPCPVCPAAGPDPFVTEIVTLAGAVISNPFELRAWSSSL